MLDKHSKEWKLVKDWATDRLLRAVRKLEVKGLDVGRSEYLRGEIAAMRSLLALEEDTDLPKPNARNGYL